MPIGALTSTLALRIGKKLAASLKFYQELKANGWEDTLRRRQAIRMGGKTANVTVGQYLDAVKVKSLIHAKTIGSYARALRKIAADIRGITHNGSDPHGAIGWTQPSSTP